MLQGKEGTHHCGTIVITAATGCFLRRGSMCGGLSSEDRHRDRGNDGGCVCAACFEDVVGGDERREWDEGDEEVEEPHCAGLC